MQMEIFPNRVGKSTREYGKKALTSSKRCLVYSEKDESGQFEWKFQELPNSVTIK
jgi:hypothetical protein